MLGTTAGKYRIIDRLGRGSMGTVYRASDETLHRDVAIKVLNADFNDPAAGRRFRAEAIAIARLNHPGIAKIYDLFEHDGQWLMAMELVQGETLESLVTRAGPRSADEAADLAWQALVALEHAHAMGVVHRDLKPANIMVADGRLKIMDFGIARVAGSEHLTSAGLRMGTPAYMAPEQVMGQEIDARTDIFAMGCVLFFLATAKLPFKGETAMEVVQSRLHDMPTPLGTLRHDMPEWLARVVARALARDPGSRFQTATDFREAIERGRSGLPVEVDPPSAIPSHLMETVLPGSMAIPDAIATTPARSPMPPAETHDASRGRLAASTSTTQLRFRPASHLPLWIGTAAIAVAIGTVLWFRPWQSQPAPPPTQPPPGAAQPPTVTPPASAPAIPSPPASGTPTPGASGAAASSGAPTSSRAGGAPPIPGAPATPTPATTGRRGGADAAIWFDTVKVLKITGRKGEDVDASIKFGGGAIAVVPRRVGDANPVTFLYRELLAATFVKEREPKWSPKLAAPPADLDLPGGLFVRRSRPWLVLQGQSRYVVVTLSDADAEQILTAVTDHSRVKIDRK